MAVMIPAEVLAGASTTDVATLVQQLLHYYSAASGPPRTRQVLLAANVAQQVFDANPRRIQSAIQLPAGMTAFVGADRTLTTANGYQLPLGGDEVGGPEAIEAMWIVATAAGTITVWELLGDHAYPVGR